ncbi:MAG: 5-formyltetrahydrofolate cyclo-ligase [Cyanobacteria bacterium J069]|nr:MAG: 5-formyltetrahydrofolate cyclo-ligase [Cyanobacteria bacterium J069]
MDLTAASPSDRAQEKAILRRSLLKARQSIHPDLWRQKSDRLCAHLQSWDGFVQARTILVYFSVRQEPDLSPLFRLPKRWGFPRCVEKDLIWHRWSPDGAGMPRAYPLQTGMFGIPEPHPSSLQLNPAEVDLILVPALACDVQGYRLGYGGGFYDRMLSKSPWRSKPTVGIVFEYARVPRLPRDPWDRPLHGICTETGLFLANG